MILTQQEVEARMYQGGIKRADTMMTKAEENGEAARNPYAATIMRDFVLPLAARIEEALASKRAGRRAGHVALLSPLPTDSVAYLTVRSILNSLMNCPDGAPTLRKTASAIGALVHQELVLAQIEHLAPDLYFTLANDFNRRRSKNVRHRLTVFKMQAKKAGLEWAEWAVGDRDQVGVFLLEQAEELGLCEIDSPLVADGTKFHGKRTTPLEVRLTPDVLETISRIKGFVAITSPMYGPCVEPPLDWTGFTGGGFHTTEMRRVHPYFVKAHATARELLRDHSMPTVWRCANALQKTPWRVNQRVLDTVKGLHRVRVDDTGEVVSIKDLDKPAQPLWLEGETDPEARTTEQATEFLNWKHLMRDWYTARKIRGVRLGRYHSAVNVAENMRDQPRLYFVYFADSRGRLYPLTYGVNPQGSDLQKSLLHFADGMPLLDDDAKKWFCIQGANKWGFDKAPLAERAAWHSDKEELLLSFADDPLNNTGWEAADCPLQFLSWCMEFAEWRRLGDDFESRIPISMDGSCNGLQHFSAMFRDEIGGGATNLLNNPVMQDIYKIVADKTTVLMKASVPCVLTLKWINHGINRSLVKRAVMTTPYGVTQRSAVGYVVDDYMRVGKSPEFEVAERWPAAQLLMGHGWDAIATVVIKAREGMDWLKASATAIIKSRGDELDGVISWESPSGFLATQSYFDIEEHRVRTRLHGVTRLLVVSETDSASVKRHAAGLAPNFVHSMDAAHLHLTAAAGASLGIDALAMIHDDYGTHAANTQKLFMLIRVCFVDMYTQHDPIADFAKLYPECKAPPSRGGLDINEVIYSDYFYS